MLISHEKKFIFLKTYKTGSSSIESVLRKYCTDSIFDFDDKEIEYHNSESIISEKGIVTFPRHNASVGNGKNNSNKDYFWDHMPAYELKEKIGQDIWESYYKFCVVRNPFERVLSLLYFIYFRKMDYLCQGGYIGENVKEEWIFELVKNNFRNKLDKTYDNFFDSDIYLVDGKCCVDRLIRYEHLQEGIDEVFQILNIPERFSDLPKINSKYKRNVKPRDILSEDLVDFIKENSKYELDVLGYDLYK